jgi:hypothetical protein
MPLFGFLSYSIDIFKLFIRQICDQLDPFSNKWIRKFAKPDHNLGCVAIDLHLRYLPTPLLKIGLINTNRIYPNSPYMMGIPKVAQRADTILSGQQGEIQKSP